jgi:hypothetical protein
MPVVGHTDPDGRLLVGRFFERITAEQLVTEAIRVTQQIPPSSEFATLMIIEASVDMSAIDAKAINAIREARKAQFEARGLRRRAGAAVIDSAVDVELILRLWNALSEADQGPDFHFETFQEIDPALRHLQISPEVAFPVIDETVELSAPLRRISSNAVSGGND